jgi:hypothetical protein
LRAAQAVSADGGSRLARAIEEDHMPTIKLTSRAQEMGAPQALEALARAEIVRTFGPKFKFPSAPSPTAEIRVYIPQAHLVAVPVGPALWIVDTINMHRISAFTEPLRFTPRAMALIVNLGWCIKEVEAEARRVLAEGDADARILLKISSVN